MENWKKKKGLVQAKTVLPPHWNGEMKPGWRQKKKLRQDILISFKETCDFFWLCERSKFRS